MRENCSKRREQYVQLLPGWVWFLSVPEKTGSVFAEVVEIEGSEPVDKEDKDLRFDTDLRVFASVWGSKSWAHFKQPEDSIISAMSRLF